MSYDLQEQETLDNIKAWWAQWGNLVIGVIVTACLVFAAFNFWKIYQAKQGTEAALGFEGLQTVIKGKDNTKISAASDALAAQFPRTAFAGLGALAAGKALFDGNDLPNAKKQLQWAADNAKDEDMRHVARLRLVSVLLDEKNMDGAMALVNTKHPDHFASQYADRKGDILFIQGKLEEARAAYLLAYDKAGKTSQARSLIQTKLEAAGGQVKPEADAKSDKPAA